MLVLNACLFFSVLTSTVCYPSSTASESNSKIDEYVSYEYLDSMSTDDWYRMMTENNFLVYGHDYFEIKDYLRKASEEGKRWISNLKKANTFSLIEMANQVTSMSSPNFGGVFAGIEILLKTNALNRENPNIKLKRKLENLSKLFSDLFGTLIELLQTVTNSKYPENYNVLGLNYKQRLEKLSTATTLLAKVVTLDPEGSIAKFNAMCEYFEIFRINLKNVIAKDSAKLKPQFYKKSRFVFEKASYNDFVAQKVSLFYLVSILCSTCDSTKYLNASITERKKLYFGIEKRTEILVEALTIAIDRDHVIGFQPLLKLTEVEALKDNGKTPNLAFSQHVFELLKAQFGDFDILFTSWSDPVGDAPKAFNPYEGNDRSVEILSTIEKKSSYIHYWLSKWNRNMLLYIRPKNVAKSISSWQEKVQRCRGSIDATPDYDVERDRDIPEVNTIFCDLIVEKFRMCLKKENATINAIGCIRSLNPLNLQMSENYKNDVIFFNKVVNPENESTNKKCGNERLPKCPSVFGLVYILPAYAE